MKKNPVYVITCFYVEDKSFLEDGRLITPKDFSRKVEWGFFHEYSIAFEYVKENYTDLYENGYYNMVRIEERNPGITSFHLDKHYWFDVKHNPEEDSYAIDFISKCFLKKSYDYNFQKTLK